MVAEGGVSTGGRGQRPGLEGPGLGSAHPQAVLRQGLGPWPVQTGLWVAGEGVRGVPPDQTSCLCSSSQNHPKGGIDCGAESPGAKDSELVLCQPQ